MAERSPIFGQITPGSDTFLVIDPDALSAFIADGGGPVMRELTRRATNVQTAAKIKVGKRTRTLERSIVKRPGVDSVGPFVAVVTEGVPYAGFHHDGNTRGWRGNPFLRDSLRYASD